MSKIKFFVMDVDGTLTDGKIYMGQDGEIAKAFDIKDGCGIFFILPKHGITPVIITARESKIVENRCSELNISELYQGTKDKLKTLNELLEKYEMNLNSVAYVGDDTPDISCMEAVKKAGGLVLCPSDAIQEIKALADYVSVCRAGNGAVRDCINFLTQPNYKIDPQDRIKRVISMILKEEFDKQVSGVLSDGTPYTIQEYYTKEESECILESHRNHIDVQYMIYGNEQLKIYTHYGLTSSNNYNKDKDVEYWSDGVEASNSLLVPGSLMVIMNNIPHKGGIKCYDSVRVKKLVCKIEV